MKQLAEKQPAQIVLDQHQHAAVTSDAAPLLLLAGPGSGKTEVLAQRVVWRNENDDAFDPKRALIATFTRQAAQELRSRLLTAGVRNVGSLGTIHAAALRQIRQYEESRNNAPHKVLSNRRNLINELVTEHSRQSGSQRGGGAGHGGTGRSGTGRSRAAGMVNQICIEIDWAQARGITPDKYGDIDGPSRIGSGRASLVAAVFARFQAVKHKRNLLDFDDVLSHCRWLIVNDESFAAQQRWSLRHFFVDEFQDVNPMQFELLKAWLGERTDLFAVGDPNQSIYGWNGAEPRYLTEFETHFPGATTMRLRVNRRSTPPIVKAAEAALGVGASAGAAQDGLAQKDQLAQQDCLAHSGVAPTFTGYPDEQAEAAGIAALLRSKLAGGANRGARNGCAVLARNHAQLKLIAGALVAAAVPCRMAGVRTLIDQPEATELRNRLAQERDFATAVRDYTVELRSAETPDAETLGTGQPGAGPSRAYKRVLELAQDYVNECHNKPTGEGFRSWLAELSPYDIDPAESSYGVVDLATLHAAKGRQWRHVIVAGMHVGISKRSSREQSEERRLLYVAMTRAIETLHLTWSESRGRLRWLDEIEAANATEPLASAEQRAAGLAQARAALDSALPESAALESVAPDSAALESVGNPPGTLEFATVPGGAVNTSEYEAQQERRKQLEQWRSTAARSYQVDEQTLLDDGVLAAIAQYGLGSLDSLSKATGLSTMRLARLHKIISEQLDLPG